MNNYIKFPGVFKPGLTDVQYITEAKYVKGSYIVLDTISDRDALDASILVTGLLVYVNETDTEYRYTTNGWIKNVPAFEDAPVDGNVYGRKDGQWVIFEIDNSKIESSIDTLSNTVDQLTNTVNELNESKAEKEVITKELEELSAHTEDCINNVEAQVQEVKELLESNAYGYAKLTDIPDVSEKAERVHSHNITEIEGYIPTDLTGYAKESFVKDEIAKIEIPSTEGLASEDFVRSEIAKAELNGGEVNEEELSNLLANYYKKDESYSREEVDAKIDAIPIPSVEGLATEQFVTERIAEINIPTHVSQLENDSEYVKASEVEETLSNYYDKTAVENLVDEAVNAIELPEIDTSDFVSNEQLNNELDVKADEVPFTTDKFVGKAIGGFVVNASMKGLTIAEILSTLLELTEVPSEEPSTPDTPVEPEGGVIADIIANELSMYSVNREGKLVAEPFEVMVFTPEEAAGAPVKSGFYQIVENGEVLESGYQDLQIVNDEMYYVIALPKSLDYNTMCKLQAFDSDENMWYDCLKLPLVSDSTVVSSLCSEAGVDFSAVDTEQYTIWALEDICTGSKLRYIIEEGE